LSLYYYQFEIDKKNGSKRLISAPNSQLKILLQRLKVYLEQLYQPHSSASAFIAERGIIYNAQKHIKKAVVFNIDLNDFYGQIHFGRIRGLLIAKPYSLYEKTATIIAHMCCLERVLPQGAPTSPIISNMICRKLDRELSYLAMKNKAFYSRYADDITFSFRTLELNDIYYHENVTYKESREVFNIIDRNGFSINNKKTRLQTYKERQVVTGLKVNEKVNLDRRYIRTTRAMIHSLSQNITTANQLYEQKTGCNGSTFQYVVAGRLNFIGMVKGKGSSVYKTLADKFNSLELDRKVPLIDKIKKSDVEERLYFSSHKDKLKLQKAIWVVSFEGITDCNEELIQGTAFTIEGNRIITASHTFAKAGNPKYCYLHNIHSPAKKYKAILLHENKVSDIAELKFETEQEQSECLIIAPMKQLNAGFKVSAVGFPQLLLGHQSVTIIQCTIINSFIKSTFKHYEIDKDFHGGISGAPVLNAYMQVVGMALLGLNTSVEIIEKNKPFPCDAITSHGGNNAVKSAVEIIDKKNQEENERIPFDAITSHGGNNAFISAEYFLQKNKE